MKPGDIYVEPSPSGGAFDVLEATRVGGMLIGGHRHTCMSRSGALKVARELRRGERRWCPDKRHTVRVTPKGGDPLAALLGGA